MPLTFPALDPPLVKLVVYVFTGHRAELAELHKLASTRFVALDLDPPGESGARWLYLSGGVPREDRIWWRFDFRRDKRIGSTDSGDVNVEKILTASAGADTVVFFDGTFEIPGEQVPPKSFIKLFSDIETVYDGIPAALQGATFSLTDKSPSTKLLEIKWQHNRSAESDVFTIELGGRRDGTDPQSDVFKESEQDVIHAFERFLGKRTGVQKQ